jgi:hypothetical protein
VAFSLFNTAPAVQGPGGTRPSALLLDRSAGSKTDPMTVIDRAPAVRSIWHGRHPLGLAVLTKLVWENMKTRCATSRQRLLSRLTTVERAWRPLVSDRLICDIQYMI